MYEKIWFITSSPSGAFYAKPSVEKLKQIIKKKGIFSIYLCKFINLSWIFMFYTNYKKKWWLKFVIYYSDENQFKVPVCHTTFVDQRIMAGIYTGAHVNPVSSIC